MTIKVEAGKFYRLRDGSKVGPMIGPDRDGDFRNSDDGRLWHADGVRWKNCDPTTDIVAVWVDCPDEWAGNLASMVPDDKATLGRVVMLDRFGREIDKSSKERDRVAELLEANNRFEQDARDARRERDEARAKLAAIAELVGR